MHSAHAGWRPAGQPPPTADDPAARLTSLRQVSRQAQPGQAPGRDEDPARDPDRTRPSTRGATPATAGHSAETERRHAALRQPRRTPAVHVPPDAHNPAATTRAPAKRHAAAQRTHTQNRRGPGASQHPRRLNHTTHRSANRAACTHPINACSVFQQLLKPSVQPRAPSAKLHEDQPGSGSCGECSGP